MLFGFFSDLVNILSSHDQGLYFLLVFSAPNAIIIFQFLGQIILCLSSGPLHMLFPLSFSHPSDSSLPIYFTEPSYLSLNCNSSKSLHKHCYTIIYHSILFRHSI